MTERTAIEQAVYEGIEEFRQALIDADIEFVGTDTEYVPDAPRLQDQMGVQDGE